MFGHGSGNSHTSKFDAMKILDNLCSLLYQKRVNNMQGGMVFQYSINEVWRDVMMTGQNVQYPQELAGKFYGQRNTVLFKDVHVILAVLLA